MKRKVTRYRWDYEKDEKWLNDQAKQGWNLVETNGLDFYFSDEELEKFAYRIIILEKAGRRKNSELIELLKFEKIECLEIFGVICYLRKNVSDGPFELFSDLDSKIRYAKFLLRYRWGIFTSIAVTPLSCLIAVWILQPVRSEYDWLVILVYGVLYLVASSILISKYLSQRKRYNELRKEHIIQE